MNTVLFTKEKSSSWDTVLMRILSPVICFNVGGAGGVFAPSLAAGASIGSFLSGLFDLTGHNANILILSGMVGFLTEVTNTPFTSDFLVLEMTDRYSVIFHLLVSALFYNVVALMIDKHSFYYRFKKRLHGGCNETPGCTFCNIVALIAIAIQVLPIETKGKVYFK